MFKGIGNFASMIKQAQEIGSRMQGMADELRTRKATGAAGGGLVEIEVNGLSEVLKCRIDPSLLGQNDRELLEDLVAAAVNQAMDKAKQLHADALKGLTGNLDLPGLEEAMGKLTGGGE
jgi:DNA-binding YbaB/EbfC family protein